MKVVLDTNVLLVSIPPNSKYSLIYDAFSQQKYSMVITTDIYLEYLEVTDRLSAKGVVEYIKRALNIPTNIIKPEIFYYWNLINADPEDNKFIDAYVAASADYLVTNDAHFNEAKKTPFPPINIISAGEFLEVLKGL